MATIPTIDKKFTEICSEQTIFSDKQGFFGEMFDNVKDMCSEKWLSTTFNCTSLSDADKLKLLFDEPNISGELLGTLEHVAPVYRQKDLAFSYQRRKMGEKLYEQKDLKNALICLTQAILRAPAKGVDMRYDGGLTLALAFWSRSAVLIELCQGSEALVDIQCAIDNGLENLKKQLEYYVRLAKANALIGDKNRMSICLNLARTFCDIHRFPEIEAEIKNIVGNPPPKKIQVPELTGGEHSRLQHASNKIDIQSSEELGNFAVASENLMTGDTIITEKPIAACLLPKYFGSHCLNCLRRIEVAYGCPNCSGVAFCSMECSRQACTTYHKYECKFTDMMIGSGMSILCFIALRMITQENSVENAIQRGQQIIGELCGHSSQRPATDYLQRSVMAAFLLRILQCGNFFGRRTSQSAYPNSELEYRIGEVLIGLLQVLQFNAHEVYETKADEKQQLSSSIKKLMYVGAAIYGSAVYFNHSCYPDVVRYFVGTTIVLCAARPIKPGETVSENYGPTFAKQTLQKRQINLQSRYWFKCNCICCIEDWPTLEKLNNKARLRCSNSKCSHLFSYPTKSKKSVKCPKCKESTNLEVQIATLTQAESLYQTAAELMDAERLSEAARSFIDGINMFYSVASPPHRDTHIAQESLRCCLSNIGCL